MLKKTLTHRFPTYHFSSAFHHLTSQEVPSFNLKIHTFEHTKLKTPYFHVEANDPNNLFSISFRTLPTNHKGIPHILEHMALCGSKKYPIRDPFFKMIKRSLNTFMNAFTCPDLTCYPYSTQN
jgi:presequence protease